MYSFFVRSFGAGLISIQKDTGQVYFTHLRPDTGKETSKRGSLGKTMDEPEWRTRMAEPYAIEVKDVSMHFNMNKEKLENLKEYFIKFMKRDLRYEKFAALEDISFQIAKGDVFGIVGLNGSGKSTLLKVISGILKPTTGSVITRGQIAPLIELGAGFDMELTARENIFLNGSVLRYYKKYMHEIDQMLPYYLKSLEILCQNYTVPVAISRSIDDAPDIFKPGLKDMIARIDAGDSTIKPYMDFAIKYPVRDSMRMMRLLYRLSLGAQENKYQQLLMFSKSVSNLQNKAREVKYKNRLSNM